MTTIREPIGFDWLDTFCQKFQEEFDGLPENEAARHAVECAAVAEEWKRKQVVRPEKRG